LRFALRGSRVAVRDADGQPLANARVTLVDGSGARVVFHAGLAMDTDAAGIAAERTWPTCTPGRA
jgi:hypothetical protein